MDFISEFVGTEIKILVVLLFFSLIAYYTFFICSKSDKIKKLKNVQSSFKDKNGNDYSLYKVLLIQLKYSINSEIAVIVILLLDTFLALKIPIWVNAIVLIISIIVLLNIICITYKKKKNMYLSFWN